MALLLCVLLGAAQEDTWEKVVERLGHDDFTERDKADQRLRQAGEPARPALEKAVLQGDPETRARSQEILAELDAGLPHLRRLNAFWTVTVPEREMTLGELAGLLESQVPASVEVPAALADTRVCVGARNVGFFRFLDRVTETHRGIAFAPGGKPGVFRLMEGKPARAPVCYPGPIRIALDRITLESWERFGSTWRGASLVLAVAWQPDFSPIVLDHLPYKLAHQVTDVEIFDEDGKQIRGIGAHYDAGFPYARERMSPMGWRVRVRIPDPPAGTKRLSRIRGKLSMIFPTQIETVEFKTPVKEVTESKSIGVFTLKYSNCQRTEYGVTTAFSISRPAVRTKGDPDERVNLAAQYAEYFARAVGADGKEYPFKFQLGDQENSSSRESRLLSGYFEVAGEVTSFKVPLIINYYSSPIEFEFRNVELP